MSHCPWGCGKDSDRWFGTVCMCVCVLVCVWCLWQVQRFSRRPFISRVFRRCVFVSASCCHSRREGEKTNEGWGGWCRELEGKRFPYLLLPMGLYAPPTYPTCFWSTIDSAYHATRIHEKTNSQSDFLLIFLTKCEEKRWMSARASGWLGSNCDKGLWLHNTNNRHPPTFVTIWKRFFINIPLNTVFSSSLLLDSLAYYG